MAASYQDLFIEKGASFASQLTLYNDDGKPYNLSGYTISSQARLSPYSANAALIFSTDIVDSNNGIIKLSASSANTANIYAGPVSKLQYDVLLNKNTIITRILEGQVFVSQSITK